VFAFCRGRFGVARGRSSCLNYLYWLGFVVRRPKKRLLKADEAHFYADADLRGAWVLNGDPALVDSTSPRWGEEASYYSAVCPETGEVVHLALEGNSSAATSVAFLAHPRAGQAEPLIVVWDNGPAHSGEPLRACPATPALRRRLVRLPAHSPDFNADEHLWGWIREDVTANTCFGTAATVRAHVEAFFAGLATRPGGLRLRRCTVLQARVDGLDAVATATDLLHQAHHSTHADADPNSALV
jgi:hypothetical protein